ncbi:hypothetical protein MHM88_11320 [Epibacterium sp. MM17-32]|uniref:hypothetical protein n=1 Tax=Epibacterium sp. MM17-32 TaxID=2917734 RepID=UPI001EF47506|nr:hypothetical protein [Epibacterium sp. MM17-32]MCG7628398.1 hypothetical protein [Epibacterium sp. MM17-32]
MTSRATEELLASLHGKMAEAMQKRLESDDLTASDLNVIRQFLKDNGINSDGASDPKLKSLADDLPEDLDDGKITPIYGRG